MCKKLFVDMDGTLYKWDEHLDDKEKLYKKGYFITCRPHLKMIEGIKTFIKNNPDVEVFILSAYFDDSLYARREKDMSLDYFLPEIKRENRIYVPYGTIKAEFAAMHQKVGKIDDTCFLLDDYSKNLHEWEAYGGIGIKCKTKINGTKGTWHGPQIYYKEDDITIAETLNSYMSDVSKNCA